MVLGRARKGLEELLCIEPLLCHIVIHWNATTIKGLKQMFFIQKKVNPLLKILKTMMTKDLSINLITLSIMICCAKKS
jgi:hypothetical protein